MRIIGIDPGLRITGWGIIDTQGSRLTHVGHGVVTSDDKAALSDRLRTLYDGLYEVVERYQPAGAAVEQTALHVAAQHGHLEVVEGLLRAGADANLSDSEARALTHRLQPHAAGLHPTRPGCNRVHPGCSPMHPGEHGAPPRGGRG